MDRIVGKARAYMEAYDRAHGRRTHVSTVVEWTQTAHKYNASLIIKGHFNITEQRRGLCKISRILYPENRDYAVCFGLGFLSLIGPGPEPNCYYWIRPRVLYTKLGSSSSRSGPCWPITEFCPGCSG